QNENKNGKIHDFDSFRFFLSAAGGGGHENTGGWRIANATEQRAIIARSAQPTSAEKRRERTIERRRFKEGSSIVCQPLLPVPTFLLPQWRTTWSASSTTVNFPRSSVWRDRLSTSCSAISRSRSCRLQRPIDPSTSETSSHGTQR